MCSVFLQLLRIDDVLAKCICFYLYIRCCFNKLYSECDENLYGWYICDWFSDQLSEYICWLITGKDIKAGDTLIGIASSGVHSNGFSLVRSVFTITEESLNTYYDSLGKTLGEALLAPTKIYVKTLKEIKNAGVRIKGCSHITGGGFYENVPRMLPEGAHAVIKKDSYEVPPIFKMLQNDGEIEEKMMYNTFNMGIGMVLAVDSADVDKVLAAVKAAGETGYVIGEVKAGEKGVTVC